MPSVCLASIGVSQRQLRLHLHLHLHKATSLMSRASTPSQGTPSSSFSALIRTKDAWAVERKYDLRGKISYVRKGDTSSQYRTPFAFRKTLIRHLIVEHLGINDVCQTWFNKGEVICLALLDPDSTAVGLLLALANSSTCDG